MRRYIAYLAISAAMLVASGAALAPTVLNMDADLAYADGQTLYFKATRYAEDSPNGNYAIVENGGALSFLDETDVDNAGDYIISDIADTIRGRLDTWGISEYEVSTQGYDTVAVSLRTPKDAAIQYTYLQDYLSFSGQHYGLDASNTASDSSDPDGAYIHDERWETILDGQTARIEEIDMNSYSVPVVVMTIQSGDEYKESFLKLLEYCEKNTQEEIKDDDGNVTQEGKACALVVWNNRIESDRYEDKSTNPNVAKKIVGEWNVANNQCVWYSSDDDKENKNNPQLQLIPSSVATSGEQYDPNHTKEAYEAAVYLCNKMNASSFTYKNAAGNDTEYAVTFTYSEATTASVESLTAFNKWSISLNNTKTLWTSLGVLLAFAIILAFFERMLAFHHVANVAAVSVGSLLLFSAMGSQFNIAALIALGVNALVTLFGSLYHSRRLKDEMYKGRTLKKANQEATRKSVLPIIDAGVITALFGVFLYVLGGDIASKAGVMLVIGGLLSIVANLVLTRLQFWLLANDNTFPSHIEHQLGVRTDRIPNLAKEEKQSFFGTYAERDFTKGKKIGGIAMGLLILAGIGTMIGFGVTHNGDVYNDASFQGGGTVLRIDVRADKSNQVYDLAYSESGKIYDPEAGAEATDLFHQYKINGKTLAELTSDFVVSSSPKVIYSLDAGADVPTEYHWYYYEATLNAKLAEENNDIQVYNPVQGAFVPAGYSTLTDLSEALVNGDDINVIVTFKQVSSKSLTPYLWQIALGVGIGFAAVFVYMLIRYYPSRALASTLLALGVSYLSVAFFVITRIVTAPIAGLAAIPVAVLAMVFALFTLGQEKNIFRESREKEKNTLTFHMQCLQLAAQRESHTTIVYFLICWIVFIIALIGPAAYFMPQLGAVIGLGFAVMAALVLLVPFTKVFAKLFGKIKIKPRKKKQKKGGQLMKKRNSAEPEEAIFIGIND